MILAPLGNKLNVLITYGLDGVPDSLMEEPMPDATVVELRAQIERLQAQLDAKPPAKVSKLNDSVLHQNIESATGISGFMIPTESVYVNCNECTKVLEARGEKFKKEEMTDVAKCKCGAYFKVLCAHFPRPK